MKKILSLILCLIIISSLFSLSVFAERGESNFSFGYTSFVEDDIFTLGDANGDGKVNSLDSYAIKAEIAGFTADVPLSRDGADIFADGRVTAVDLFYLKSVFADAKSISDFENGSRVYSFNIAGAPLSEFDIVLPEGTPYNNNMYFAYELLLNYGKKATGIELSKAYGASSKAHGIYLHDASCSELGERLGNDGFRYEVNDGDLHIYGTMRGNMYAAYDILEDYFGFLFYDNVFTMTTKKRYINMEEGLIHEEIPGFTYRFTGSTAWGSTIEHTLLPRRLNAAPLLGDADAYHGEAQGSRMLSAHSYWYYDTMAKGKMPEDDGTMTLAQRYEAKYEDGGGYGAGDTVDQPCAVDNDVFEHLYSGFIDTVNMCIARGYEMLMSEGSTTPSFSMNDSAVYCPCRICNAIANGTTVKRVYQSTYDSLVEWYPGVCSYNSSKKELSFKKEGYFALYLALANRAAERFQEFCPGAKIETIVYGCDIPESIKPGGHLVIDYCGAISGCVNHRYGENKCNVTGAVKDDPAFHALTDDEAALRYWVEEANKTGSIVQCIIYASDNFSYHLYDIPSYFDLYYDIQWLYNLGVKGIADDSPNNGNAFNGFESLKAKLFAELEWNPTMSFDEYVGVIKKYLRAIYGNGYEHIFNYLTELCNANEAVTVCVPFFAAAFDFYSKSYIREHYEYMRNELLLAKAEQGKIGKSCHTNIDRLFMTCEVLGLSASYDSMYTNGTAESRRIYEERYTDLYNYIKNDNVVLSSVSAFKLPDTVSFSQSPLIQFYRNEHRYKSNGYYCE